MMVPAVTDVWLAAVGTLPGPRLGLELPRFNTAAGGTDETLRPAGRKQVFDAGCFIWEALLELDQRAGKTVISVTRSPTCP